MTEQGWPWLRTPAAARAVNAMTEEFADIDRRFAAATTHEDRRRDLERRRAFDRLLADHRKTAEMNEETYRRYLRNLFAEGERCR